jgi:hypothetical protein
MASETLRLIDLSDIAGIEFVCTFCTATTIRPLRAFDRTLNLRGNCLTQCPKCLKSIVDPGGSGEEAITDAAEALRQLRKLPVRIRFQVTGV